MLEINPNLSDLDKSKIISQNLIQNNQKNNQIETLQSLQKNYINNINAINKLKASNYEQLISRLSINYDLREDYLNNNDLTDNDITILTNLYNKISGKNISKEKKKKNRGNKDGMGLLLSLDVSESTLLYQPYTNTNINKYIYFECYLYSINISINYDFNDFGFIFPVSLGDSFNIKLINRKNKNVSYAKIKKEKKIQLINEQMEHIITYHYCICNQLLRGKKNIDNELIQSFMKNLYKNDIFKKYFFVPIKKIENKFDIDKNKILKCVSFLQEKCPKELFPRLSEIIMKNKYNNEENRQNLFKLLENKYFVTDYKINRIYKFEDIIYKEDDLNTFVNKYTFNTKELNQELKIKLLEAIKENDLNNKNINAKYIMENLPLEEDVENKKILGGIIGYRKIPSKYKIEISDKNNYYISCKFGCLNIIKKINYTYNSNILKSNSYIINKVEYSDNSQNDTEKYAKILPPDRIFSYYINKNDVELFEIIPSIFTNFEELVKIPQFIKDYDLLLRKPIREKKFIQKNFHYLQWAFTLHM